MADLFTQLGFEPLATPAPPRQPPPPDIFASLGFEPLAPAPAPFTPETAGAEMDRVISGQVLNAPRPTPVPQRPAPVPFYQRPVPLPGTDRTGIPGVAMIPPGGVTGPGPMPTPRNPAVPDYLATEGLPVNAPPDPNGGRQPVGVRYDPYGARPDEGYFAAARAGAPFEPGQIPTANTMPRVGDELMRSGAESALGTIEGTGKGLRLLSSDMGPEGGGIGRFVGGALEQAAKAGKGLIPGPSAATEEMVGPSFMDDPSQLFNPMYMARQVGNAGGSMVAFMAPEVAALSRVTTASGVARAAAAQSIAESLANSAEVYDQAIAMGKTEKEAAGLFRQNLPLDLPFTWATNKLGLFNERIRSRPFRAVAGTAIESGQEVGQGAIGRINLGKPWNEGAGEEALGGALGGPIGAAMVPQHGGMADVEPMAPMPPQQVPARVAQAPGPTSLPGTGNPIGPGNRLQPQMEDVEPLAPIPAPAQPAPAPPPAAVDISPEDLYHQATAVAMGDPQPGTGLLRRKLGISRDDARAMLERMVQDGLLAPVPVKDGTTVYKNLEKAKLRGGRSIVQKAVQLPPPTTAPAEAQAPEVKEMEEPSLPPPTTNYQEQEAQLGPIQQATPPLPPPTTEDIFAALGFEPIESAKFGEPKGLPETDVNRKETRSNLAKTNGVEANTQERLGLDQPAQTAAEPQEVTLNSLTFSSKNGEKTEIPLGQLGSKKLKTKVVQVDPNTIIADPVRFQFKRDTGGKAGVGEELKDPDVPWNEELAGVVSVWKDPADGKWYIVNGHHRLEKAQRMGVPGIDVRPIEAKSAEEARAKGALQNISEGRGTAIDAAKFMRDTGLTAEKVKQFGIHLKGLLAKQGNAMAKLPAQLFEQVLSGDLNVERAVVIGENLDNPADMLAVAEAGAKLNDSQLREMIRRTKGGSRTEETQVSLFGEETVSKSLIREEAVLSEGIRKQLSQEKKLFSTVGTKGAATTLSRSGNVIATEKNKEIADATAQALEIYDRLSMQTGPVADALAAGARELASGVNSATVRENTYAAVRQAVHEALGGAAARSSERAPVVDRGRGSDAGTGKRGEQTSIPIAEQPDNRASLTGERLTAGFASALTPEEKRAGLKPAEDTQQSMFEEPKERTGDLFGRDTPSTHVEGRSEVVTPQGIADRIKDLSGSERKRVVESLQDGEKLRDAIALARYGVMYSDLRSSAVDSAHVREMEREGGIERDTSPEQLEEDEDSDIQAAAEAGPILKSLIKSSEEATERLRKRGITSGSTLSANAFLDPRVIKDMAVAIAGDVAKGVINATNYVKQIVQRFGQASTRVAREVFRRAQRMAKDEVPASRVMPNAQEISQLVRHYGVTEQEVRDAYATPPKEAARKASSYVAANDVSRGTMYEHLDNADPWWRQSPTAASPAPPSTTKAPTTKATAPAPAPTKQATPPASASTAPAPVAGNALEKFRKNSQAARQEKDESFLQKIAQKVETFGHWFTREYEHLAPGAAYAQLRMELKKVTKGKGVAIHRAAQTLIDQLGKLSKEEFGLFLDVVALNDLVERIKEQISNGDPVNDDDMPWGLTKREAIEARRQAGQLAKQNPKIVEALRQRVEMWKAVKPAYTKAMAAAGYDVADRLTRLDYYRHRVLEHLSAKKKIGQQGTGAGQRFKTPIGRGFLQKAYVNRKEYSLDYIRSEFEVLSEMMFDTSRAEFIAFVADPKNKLNIAPDLAKQAAAHNKALIMPAFAAMAKRHNKQHPGAKTMTAEDMYRRVMKSHPKDPGFKRRLTKQMAGKQYIGTLKQAYNAFALQTHGIYQPIEGEHFFLANSLTDKVAEEIQQLGIGIVTDKDIRKVQARGAKRPQLVLPREVIETMKQFMQPPKGENALVDKVFQKPLQAWKVLKLIHPVSVVKYNLRNASGDIERFVTNIPQGLKYAGRALKEIREYKRTGHPPSPEFKEWWTRGGMDSNLQVAELGEVNKLDKLEKLLSDPDQTAAAKAGRAIVGAWKGIWGAGRHLTDVREGILRYSAFLEYRRQIAAGNGRPNNFGASIREEVMALRDNDDKAYKLANDLMLAYDEVSTAGRVIRRNLIPFWSFQEQNARAYYRLVKNAALDARYSAAVGQAALGGIRVSAWTAINVGKTVGLAMGLKSLLSLFNLWDLDDEEGLPENVQMSTHIALGRDSDGKILGFTRIGLVDDLLEWAGLQAAPYYVREYMNGRMTLQEIAREMAKSPVNKVVQGLTPMLKTTGEFATGQAIFPDVFAPRKIRDRYEYIAKELGVSWAYKKFAGKPQKPVTAGSMLDFVLYRYDPKETHYNSFRYDQVPKWNVEHGKSGGMGMNESRSAEALYQVRMAIRYDDRDAFLKGLEAYRAAGGTRKGIQTAIDRLHPLGALNKGDRKAYEATLGAREKAQLKQAILFWQEHFDSKRAQIDSDAAAGKLPLKKRRK